MIKPSRAFSNRASLSHRSLLAWPSTFAYHHSLRRFSSCLLTQNGEYQFKLKILQMFKCRIIFYSFGFRQKYLRSFICSRAVSLFCAFIRIKIVRAFTWCNFYIIRDVKILQGYAFPPQPCFLLRESVWFCGIFSM